MVPDPDKDMATTAQTPTPPVPVIRGIRIFTYPKVIFLYPSFFAALICGFFALIWNTTGSPTRAADKEPAATATAVPLNAAPAPDNVGGPSSAAAPTSSQRNFNRPQNIIAVIFLGILFLNYVVMALDFPRFTVFAGLFLGTTLLLILILLAERYEVFAFFSRLFGPIYLEANAGFYFIYATVLSLVFLQVWASRYLDYWEILPNEILHHHGPWSDLERYPTLNLKFDKEIPDVFEFLMARSGRLVLTIPGEKRSIVLENVPFINQVEVRLKTMMSNLQVQAVV